MTANDGEKEPSQESLAPRGITKCFSKKEALVIPLFLFSGRSQKIKIRKDEQKNEKEENLMERCIRPHRN